MKLCKCNPSEHKPCTCGRIPNYMFFSNLKSIKAAIDDLLSMDETHIDNVLKEHHWAVDHIATSADDIEEVYKFFKTRDTDHHNNYKIKHFVQTFESYFNK